MLHDVSAGFTQQEALGQIICAAPFLPGGLPSGKGGPGALPRNVFKTRYQEIDFNAIPALKTC